MHKFWGFNLWVEFFKIDWIEGFMKTKVTGTTRLEYINLVECNCDSYITFVVSFVCQNLRFIRLKS